MKNILLFIFVLNLGLIVNAQSTKRTMSTKAPKQLVHEPTAGEAVSSSLSEQLTETYDLSDRSVTIIPIGSSGNIYSVLGNGRTCVWADPNINSVVFTHRMVNAPTGSYGSSRVAYDVSTDKGGDGSWSTNVQVYEPLGPGASYPEAAGRYPQGAIINPEGNTNPEDATFTYFIPTIVDQNDIWGGYAYGTNALTAVDPADATQTNVTSDENYFREVPNAFTVTLQGETWMADPNYDVTAENYLGQVIMNKGSLNVDGDIEYEEWLLDVLAEGDGINDTKIAFSPDGQIGYLLVMGEAASEPQAYTNYHPVLYETTDGGDTWSETANHCQLGGVDGLTEVKEFITDEVLEEYYDAGFNRDEIPYNMGFHADMVVDHKGDAHITGLIACASEDGTWYPNPGAMGTFHIWYNRENDQWGSEFLYANKTFDGDLGDVTMYNRPQIATSITGGAVFISWLDTDIEDEEGNVYPDFYCVGKSLSDIGIYTDVQIVTQFTGAMYSAFFGTMSHYVFMEIDGGTDIYTLPIVYAHMLDPQDPLAEVQYKYIDGVTLTLPHWDPGIGIEGNESLISNVKQNFPNPSLGNTTVEVELTKAANLSIEVTNLVGQVVYAESKGNVTAGDHEFTLNTENYTTGVYFYTVNSNNSLITKKMIVK
ncbi:MAG: T9SS type A sorting domain-containing protein [Bacteroidales bacterium]|nr:T9SS type A sorting domain-containing protein [Bacteroidales bacterium]